MAAPAFDPVLPKQPRHHNFSGLVSVTANPRHAVAALGGRQIVSHGVIRYPWANWLNARAASPPVGNRIAGGTAGD